MTIMVADEGLLGLTELVPSHCEIRWYSGRDIQVYVKGCRCAVGSLDGTGVGA